MSNPEPNPNPATPTIPIPTVGRIVHVPMDPTTNNGQSFAPAIITQVWNAGLVNVQIFADQPGNAWRTSVKYVPSLADINADDPARLYRWTWPPRN